MLIRQWTRTLTNTLMPLRHCGYITNVAKMAKMASNASFCMFLISLFRKVIFPCLTQTHTQARTHTQCHTFTSKPLTAKDHRVPLSNREISAGSHSLEIHCSISTLSGPLSLFALAPQRRSHNTSPLRGKDIRTQDKFVILIVTELIEAFWQEGGEASTKVA